MSFEKGDNSGPNKGELEDESVSDLALSKNGESISTVYDGDVSGSEDDWELPLKKNEYSTDTVVGIDISDLEKEFKQLLAKNKSASILYDTDVSDNELELAKIAESRESFQVDTDISGTSDELKLPLEKNEDTVPILDIEGSEEDLMKKLVLAKAEMFDTEDESGSEVSRASSVPAPDLLNLQEHFQFDMMSLRAKRASVTEVSSYMDPNVVDFIKATKNKKRKRVAHMAHLAKLPPVPEKAIHDKHLHTLVLDLDQTLINVIDEYEEGCVTLSRVRTTGETVPVYIYLRPYVFEFLNAVKDLFEVILFTAGKGSGSDNIINYLDPNNEIFRHRLFREHCCYRNSESLRTKDIRVLNRDMATIILVDNNPKNFVYQVLVTNKSYEFYKNWFIKNKKPDNSIPVCSFYDDLDDNNLEVILPILLELTKVEDVRPRLIELFGISQLFSHAEDVCETHTYSSSV